ncbi:MAG: hypothetical protein ACPL1Z_05835 [Candidatus Bathyarchaeales archaeon]
MFKAIMKVVTAVLADPQFIDIAKKVKRVQITENETHIMFFLEKNSVQNTGILGRLKPLIPHATLLTTADGTPFLNIEVEGEQYERGAEAQQQ